MDLQSLEASIYILQVIKYMRKKISIRKLYVLITTKSFSTFQNNLFYIQPTLIEKFNISFKTIL